MVLLLNNPVPLPFLPDEFSHLFLAETLFAGKLSNPSHPLWIHFETLHIFHTPTYSSMYFPGMAIFLLAGKLFFGHPFAGVVLGSGLFAVALLWMLQAFYSYRWAFYGTVIAAMQLSVFSYWANSYWGGFVAAFAGALLCGAVKRLSAKPNWVLGAIYGFSLLILANTRPLEGLVLACSTSIWLLWGYWRGTFRIQWQIQWRRVAAATLAAVVILSMGAAAMAQYFKAVTGSPTTIPYVVNQKLYGWPMTAAWMTPEPKQFRYAEMQNYWTWERREHIQVESIGNLLYFAPLKLARLWIFFMGWLLLPALIGLVAGWKSPKIRALLLWSILPAIAVIGEQSSYSHYLAPATAPIFALLVQGSRRLSFWRFRGQSSGNQIVSWVPAAILSGALLSSAAPTAHFPRELESSWKKLCCRAEFGHPRQAVLRQLEEIPGKHLVFVKYNRNPWNTLEWVYNPPAIDSARIVLARDSSREKNLELVTYYRGKGEARKVWIVEPDANPIRLYAYQLD